jgi:hypothetical protein
MTHRIPHIRRHGIAYGVLLLVLALGVGGGYAAAASKTKAITVCADKKTGILHLKNRGRCKRGQTRVSWNQQGPAGAQGPQGSQGPQGPSAASAWGVVLTSGSVFAGQGISVQHLSAGTYQLTITAAACAGMVNAPMVTVNDANPPIGHSAGAFATAWLNPVNGSTQFNVFTGVVVSGSITPSDEQFDVMDQCT